MMRQHALVRLAAARPRSPRAATTTTPPAATRPTATDRADGRPSRRRSPPASRSPRTAARPTRTPARSPTSPGFDFAATASIVDVVVAEQRGYFDELCLDVELTAELLDRQLPARRRRRGPVRLRRLVQRGRRLRHGQRRRPRRRRRRGPHGDRRPDPQAGRRPTTLEDLAGTTIGVKGKIPPSVAAMLAGAGLVEGERLRDGAARRLRPDRPLSHLDGIVGFPGYKSNEPGQLERAGIDVRPVRPDRVRRPRVVRRALHDPAVRSTSTRRRRRTSCGRRCAGLADAIADPAAATQTAIDLVEANGNPSFLSLEGESFRWADRRRAARRPRRPTATGIGVPDVDAAAGRGRRLRRGRPVRRRPPPTLADVRRRRPRSPRSTTTTPRSSGPADSLLTLLAPARRDTASGERSDAPGDRRCEWRHGPSVVIMPRRDRAPPRRLGRADRPRRRLRHVRDRGPRHPDAGLRRGAADDARRSGSWRRCTATRPTSSTRTSATPTPRSTPRSRALAHHLRDVHGVGSGDRVALAMRNYPEWVVGYWAIASLGAAVVGMNAWWTTPEMEYGLADSRPKVLIADDERLERVLPVLDGLRADGAAARHRRALRPRAARRRRPLGRRGPTPATPRPSCPTPTSTPTTTPRSSTRRARPASRRAPSSPTAARCTTSCTWCSGRWPRRRPRPRRSPPATSPAPTPAPAPARAARVHGPDAAVPRHGLQLPAAPGDAHRRQDRAHVQVGPRPGARADRARAASPTSPACRR